MLAMHVSLPDQWVNPADESAEVEDAVLPLEKFSAVPWVRLGHVAVGQTAIGSISLVNNSDVEQEVLVEKITSDSVQVDKQVYKVPANCSDMQVLVSWTPDGYGNCRETIHLKFQDRRHRLKVVVFGVGVEQKRRKVSLVIDAISCISVISVSSHNTLYPLSSSTAKEERKAERHILEDGVLATYYPSESNNNQSQEGRGSKLPTQLCREKDEAT
tara:strand:- start:1544 stop:2188 length:645 start_codon:yes stop_codon:yes gene_type:complete